MSSWAAADPTWPSFTEDGTCIMMGQYGTDVNSAAMSHQIFKIGYNDWVGNPDSTPALWATDLQRYTHPGMARRRLPTGDFGAA